MDPKIEHPMLSFENARPVARSRTEVLHRLLALRRARAVPSVQSPESGAVRKPANRTMAALLLAAALALAAPSVRAEQFSGTVVSIADCDTVTVLDATKTQYRVRLAGIDAPERKQPYGSRSKQNLANLVSRQRVVVDWSKCDRYGRIGLSP